MSPDNDQDQKDAHPDERNDRHRDHDVEGTKEAAQPNPGRQSRQTRGGERAPVAEQEGEQPGDKGGRKEGDEDASQRVAVQTFGQASVDRALRGHQHPADHRAAACKDQARRHALEPAKHVGRRMFRLSVRVPCVIRDHSRDFEAHGGV